MVIDVGLDKDGNAILIEFELDPHGIISKIETVLFNLYIYMYIYNDMKF